MRSAVQFLRQTVSEFVDDDGPSQAAALAYYTIFSLPPLLLIVTSTTSFIFGATAVESRIHYQVFRMAGRRAANQVSAMLGAIHQSGSDNNILIAAISLAAVGFAATTAFAQLQCALNAIWEVRPDPRQSEIRTFFWKRFVSFGIILALAFVLLLSLLTTAALAAVSQYLPQILPPGWSAQLLQWSNTAISFVIIAVVVATLYKLLPDAQVAWRDVYAGGVVTALLFSGGKSLFGLYLGQSNVTSFYGAAGSLAVVLVWTYYTSMIFLLGAEFTEVWARREGRQIRPEPGAVRVRLLEVRDTAEQ